MFLLHRINFFVILVLIKDALVHKDVADQLLNKQIRLREGTKNIENGSMKCIVFDIYYPLGC